MTKPEILAPVGGQEQLLAAVRCGADAVYLGGRDFNARRNAANFEDVELSAAARYCHERGVMLYVTVNTMVTDAELPALEAEADAIAQAGADAVILQDMAAARLFERRYPSIHRVASTQTAVHSIDGARFLQDAGFQSFVLARELSLDEMAAICAAVDIPAEAFVHGAHCMCVSGMCYLSSMLGGRSGNRGLCAQPCRLDWRSGERHYALSLKDMSLLPHIPALAEAGVRTLKIEGRMKRPEYVAAAVTACRAARDGETYDDETLRAVFSRSGFTDGYLTGRPDADMFGYRTKEDVTGADGVMQRLRGLYHKERQIVPVAMDFSASPEGSRLTVSDGTHAVTVSGAKPEAARNRPLDAEGAGVNLTKTGGTQYYVNFFDADIAPDLMLPASALNALRREALEKLNGLRGMAPPMEPAGSWEQIPSHKRLTDSASPLWGRFYRAEQFTGEDALERVILPVGQITPALIARLGEKLAAELPAVCFPTEEARLYERLTALKAAGLAALWTENIYGVAIGRRLGLPVLGGFGLNIANTQAADFYARQGLKSLTVSFELPMSAIRSMGGAIPRGIAAYGYLPLMRFRNCPVRAGIGCAACGGKGSLTDRRDVAFPVECGEQRYSTLLNSVPLHIAGRDDPADYRLLWFTRENREECGRVIGDFLRDRRTDAPHTGGLYYRRLL